MVRSSATTVDEFLDELDPEHRDVVEEVRATILDNLPEGYVEAVRWGMLTYEVPLDRSGPTYNGQPLMYAALTRQARHYSLYLTGPYSDEAGGEAFRAAYRETGKKLDMGKSCVRFRQLDDLPLDVVGDEIARLDVEEFLGIVDSVRG